MLSEPIMKDKPPEMKEDALFRTADGSFTVLSETYGETYHSHHGAITESLLVFIEYGLKALPAGLSQIHIFEMGFGTGLNTLLSMMHSGTAAMYYETVENNPLQPPLWQAFVQNQWPEKAVEAQLLSRIHLASWNSNEQISENFCLLKHHAALSEIKLQASFFHLIYFDAFSSEAQAELWTEAVFSRLFEALLPGGILVTYSSKGQVKKNLRAAGFQLERLPGPPGKRHVLRAQKPQSQR